MDHADSPLFESPGNSLRKSVKKALLGLPGNDKQTKVLFKELLIIQIEGIPDKEERGTWLSFIGAIDVMSNDSYVSDSYQRERTLLMNKFVGLQNHQKTGIQRKNALKSIFGISLRLKYIESF